MQSARDNIDGWVLKVDQTQEELIKLLPRKDLVFHMYDLSEFKEKVKRMLDALTVEIYEDTFPYWRLWPILTSLLYVQTQYQVPYL